MTPAAVSRAEMTWHRRRIFFCWKAFVVVVTALTVFGTVTATEDDASGSPPGTALYFTAEPSDTVAARGSDVVLNCSAFVQPNETSSSSSTSVRITWRKDGQPVTNGTDRRRTVDQDGSLRIRSVQQRGDPGLYECLASADDIGTRLSRRARLDVAELNKFTAHPNNQAVVEGHTARFQCSVSGVPDPVVTWEKDRKPLPQSDRFVQLATLGILQIENARLEDAGAYRCLAINSARQRHSNDAQLTVEPGDELSETSDSESDMLVGPEDSEVTVGSTVIFECAAVAYGSSYEHEIIWHRDDGELPVGRNRMLGHGNLEISNVMEQDDGMYMCSLKSRPSLMAEARLSVLVPPRAVRPLVNLIRPLGQGIRLMCNVTGSPMPSITWTKDGESIKNSRRTPVRELIISKATESDSGIYQCWAENTAGRLGLISRIVVQTSDDGPEPPKNLHARALSSRSVKLSWSLSPPKFQEPTIAYSIHYSQTQGGEELQTVVPGNETTIDQLLPYTEYSFYVVAYNRLSIGRASNVVRVRTLEDVPLSIPEFRLIPAGTNSVKVQWDMLPEDVARGVITQYVVKYQHSSDTKSVYLPGNVSEYTIADLESGIRYEIIVLAGTSAGFTPEGPDLPWKFHAIGNKPTSGADLTPNIQINVTGPTSIAVKWDPVPPELVGPGTLLGFKIHFRPPGVRPLTVIYDEGATEHVMLGLTPNTTYEVSFCIFTITDERELMSWTVRTPPESDVVSVPTTTTSTVIPPIPLPPAGVVSEAVNETAIRLSWRKPSMFGDYITHFTVSYSSDVSVVDSKTTATEEKEIFVTSQSTHIIIGGLEPNTVYHFAVRSHIGESFGSFGERVRCLTSEGRPSMPRNLTWLVINAIDVHLFWHPPAKPNGVVRSYTISYCDWRTHDVSPINQECKEVIIDGKATQAIVQGLKAGAVYQFRVLAVTSQGAGPATEPVLITTVITTSRPAPPSPVPVFDNDRMMGIVIGVSISSVCIIICVVIILLRNRCVPPGPGSNIMHHRCNGGVRSNGCACQEASLCHGTDTDGFLSDGVGVNGICTTFNGHRLPYAPHVDAKGCMPNGCCHGNLDLLVHDPVRVTASSPCNTYVTLNGQVRLDLPSNQQKSPRHSLALADQVSPNHTDSNELSSSPVINT